MSPWRSVLFTPGTRPDRIEKAWSLGAADVVVADLEDAVAPGDKDEARAAVVRALAATDDSRCRRAVRINAWPSPQAQADLEAVLPYHPLIVVPKADAAALEHLGARTPVLAIIETARGVLDAPAIAAVPGVEAIAFGAEDLAADAGMARSASNVEVHVPRALMALAAAAHGRVAIDMITADLDDEERFRREVQEALGLGYAGKMCLHPRQVAAAHDEMAPSAERLQWAERILAAVEKADAGQGGVVVVDGQMVDVPLVRQAKATLARAGKSS